MSRSRSGPASPAPRDQLLYTAFCRGRGFTSGLIEYFGDEFSHVATLVPSDPAHVLDARSDVIAGIPAGVQIRPRGYLLAERPVWMALPCTAAELEGIEAGLRSQQGKPYDKVAILDFALGRVRDRNFRDESAWFCSELHVWALERAARLARMVIAPNRIPPGMASAIEQALGGRVAAAPRL